MHSLGDMYMKTIRKLYKQILLHLNVFICNIISACMHLKPKSIKTIHHNVMGKWMKTSAARNELYESEKI